MFFGRFGSGSVINLHQGLGAAKDAVRMARIAKFYERLPKGPMPEIKPRGLLERYQHRYFGKNPSAARESSPGRRHLRL
jgi:Mitochondrial F1-F0 ATP synthase subunit F of fungi